MKTKYVPLARLCISLLLVSALLASLWFSFSPLHVQAYESLAHIEAIKSQKKTTQQPFKIVELVPDAQTSSIGYYIQGQEPCTTALLDALASLEGIEARKAKVDTVLAELTDLGLLGADKALTRTDYQEYFPWESAPPSAQPLALRKDDGTARQEAVKQKGKLVEQEQGDFQQNSTPTLLNSPTGNYKQDISQLVWGASAEGESRYYYNPIFTQLDSDSFEDFANPDNESNYDGLMFFEKTEDNRYTYLGTLGKGYFYLDAQHKEDGYYHFVSNLGQPYESYDPNTAPYHALANGFVSIQQNEGYFTMDVSSYTYVGTGQGDYHFIPDPNGEETLPLWYEQIYISLGYRNNNFFMCHVLDEEADANGTFSFDISVEIITPNSENFVSSLESADLFVISQGLFQEGISPTYNSDISADLRDRILAKKELGLPIWVDGQLKDSGQVELSKLVNALIGTMESGAVLENVYCFFPDDVRLAMATGAFLQPFDETLYNTETAPYRPIKAQLDYENALRDMANKGEAERLPDTVHMASALRYIINYAGQRVENKKTHIKILDIEPLAQKKSDSQKLSVDTVLSWLPQDSKLTAKDIQITTMSTAEFIGKIEVLHEVYDLVYIGTSRDHMNLKNGLPDYSDDNMDGLFYSNVGDRITTNQNMGGLLESDYNDNNKLKGSISSRYAGNDITPTKKRELAQFMSAGFPLIVSAELWSETENRALHGDRIDNCSILYEVLQENLMRPNLISARVATQSEQQNDTLKYLNLSKPSIQLTAQPPQYNYNGGNISGNLTGDALHYTFQIDNPTDPTPASTRYTVKLFIDQNGDGRYHDNEQLYDLQVFEGAQPLPYDQLAQGKTYTLQRNLPEALYGLVPWCLKVEKNGTDGAITASEIEYAFRKPEKPIKINILQITSGSFQTKWAFSLKKNETYQKLFQELKDKNLYDIQITVHSVSEINAGKFLQAEDWIWFQENPSWALSPGQSKFDRDNNGSLDQTEELADYFASFDMLILGFRDAYGQQDKSEVKGTGLDFEVALAVRSFIDTGKAILFTHDTTSSANSKDNGWKVALYFNAFVRDAVGLDRYGVTSSAYGFNKNNQDIFSKLGRIASDPLLASRSESGVVAKGYQGADLAQMIADGYSVAYEPKSDKKVLLSETQGMSSIKLASAKSTGLAPSSGSYVPGGLNTTKSVSQVNRGQITSYPYPLNLEDKTVPRMKVATTHEQYYQINMNADDIVVWYCLADDGTNNNPYTAHYNDVSNAYYIYNRGNVTYSGAGHLDPSGADEAKLFVNTMIAAYRAGTQSPSMRFDAEYHYVPMEDNNGDRYEGLRVVESQRYLSFQVADPNLATNKHVAVKFFWTTQKTPTAPSMTPVELGVYQQPQGTPLASTASLNSNVTYYIRLTDELLAQFEAQTKTHAPFYLYAQVTTTIQGKSYPGELQHLELRKLGLLTLH